MRCWKCATFIWNSRGEKTSSITACCLVLLHHFYEIKPLKTQFFCSRGCCRDHFNVRCLCRQETIQYKYLFSFILQVSLTLPKHSNDTSWHTIRHLKIRGGLLLKINTLNMLWCFYSDLVHGLSGEIKTRWVITRHTNIHLLYLSLITLAWNKSIQE